MVPLRHSWTNARTSVVTARSWRFCSSEAGRPTRTDLAQKVLHHGVAASVAEFADLAMWPAAGRSGKAAMRSRRSRSKGVSPAQPRRARAIGRRLRTAG